MRTALILLNYMDADGTIAAAERAGRIFGIDLVILVDNASPDGSADLLSDYCGKMQEAGRRIRLLRSERNAGYGSGNNLGIRMAAAEGAELCLVANPDAFFTEELFVRMRETFERAHGKPLAALGAVMSEDPRPSYGECCLSAWPERSAYDEVCAGAPLMRRLHKTELNYSPGYFAQGEKNDYLPVFAVHGSLLMVDTEKFLQAGGFDEGLFLYCEETALAGRLRDCGFETGLLLSPTYRHAGSGSITGAGNAALRRRDLRSESELYLCRNCLGAGERELRRIRRLQRLVRLETQVAAALGFLH